MSRSFWVVGARLRMPQLQFFAAGAILSTKDGESCKSYSGTVTSNVASDVWFLSLVVAGAALSSLLVRLGWFSFLVAAQCSWSSFLKILMPPMRGACMKALAGCWRFLYEDLGKIL